MHFKSTAFDIEINRNKSDNLRGTCKLIGKPSEHLLQFDCLWGIDNLADFGSSRIIFGEYHRTSENLRELLNRFEIDKKTDGIPPEFRIPGFPAYRAEVLFFPPENSTIASGEVNTILLLPSAHAMADARHNTLFSALNIPFRLQNRSLFYTDTKI